MDKNNGSFSMEDIQRLAQSDAGRLLMQRLQSQHSDAANAVRSSMQAGDTERAKNALSGFLSDPNIQALLKQLEAQNNG